MSEQVTMGHGGRRCEFAGELTREIRWREYQFRYEIGPKDDPRDWHRIRCCPACGILLIPDPEPLPVPEGCDEARLERIGESSTLSWHAFGYRSGVKIVSMHDDTLEALLRRWRRMFGKDGK